MPTARSVGARTFSLTRETALRYLWAVTRLGMAWTFLWPFMDKMFGLGHQTTSAAAWINGGNPTKGFLSGSVGAFSSFYQSIAGAGLVNWLFMIGLLAIAVSLSFGIAMRFAAAAGSIMLLLMWSASLPPSDDLFLDNHIIYALLLIGLALVGAGNTLGLGRRWAQTSLAQRYPWLT
jgi:thiosulfate dehydrogenase [quinone] large subunit